MPPLQQHLQDSARESNWIDVSKTAHKMKPALDSMGISALRNTIRTVEQNAKTDAQTDELLPLITEINRVIDECRAQLDNDFG
jgi:HPt (histidine-containing phosphotransfer) domain-containing protein